MGFDFEGGGSAVGSQLGPEQNIFGIGTTVTTAPGYTADKAAAETLRDAYATANAAWLALYTGDRSFYIRLIWTGNATAFQRRDTAGTGWEDVSRIVPGTTGTTGAVGPAGPTRTATQIAALLDAFIGNALWRSRLTGSDLLDAVDLAVGSTVWRTAHTALRSATQIVAALDLYLLGTAWRTPGSGGGGTGLDATAVAAAIAAAGHDTPAARNTAISDAIAAAGHDTPAARNTAIAAAISAAGHDTPSARDTAIAAAVAAADHDTPAERDSAIAAAIAAAAIAGAGAIPVTLLSAGSVADPGASVVAAELTLTADIIRGYLLEFVEAGTPASVGYITSDLILDQTQTYNSTPSANDLGRLALKIQTSSDKAFGHDTIHLWRSDEADKIWFAAGRTGMQTLTIRAYPLSAAVEDWAKSGNTDQIPADRLGNAPAGTGGGITTAQATDAAGALLATVSFFTYDSSTDVLTLAIPDGYILPAMLVDGTDIQKTAFRTRMGAEQSGAVRPDGTVPFTATIVGITPTADGHLTRKDYVDDLVDDLAALSGATFTGAVSGITPTGDANLTRKDYVDGVITALVDGAPSGLDTLNELAASIGDDASFATTVTNLVNARAALSGATFTGSVSGITPTDDANLARKDYVDSADNLKAALAGATFTGIVSGITPTAIGHLTRKDYVDSADDAKAALAGAVFTGAAAGIAPTADAHFVTKEYADANYGGVSSPTAHNLYAGWSADASIEDSEILAGGVSDTNSVVLPTGTGSLYMFIWRADADGGDPSEVHIAGAGDSRTSFGAATARVVETIDGQLLVSVNTFNTAFAGGETVRLV